MNTDVWWHFRCDGVIYVPCPCSNLNLPTLCLGYLWTPALLLDPEHQSWEQLKSSMKGLKAHGKWQRAGWTATDGAFLLSHSTFCTGRGRARLDWAAQGEVRPRVLSSETSRAEDSSVGRCLLENRPSLSLQSAGRM